MALFEFRCPRCQQRVRRILDVPPTSLACRQCGVELVRQTKGPTSRVVEVLDNGVMTRRLERYSDAEDVYRQHAQVKEK